MLTIMFDLHMSFKVKQLNHKISAKNVNTVQGFPYNGHIDAFPQILNSLKNLFFSFAVGDQEQYLKSCFSVSALVMT